MNVIWRTLLVILSARRRVRRGKTLDAASVSSIRLTTLPTDIDILRHMNNGRYLSLFDLGRWDLLIRTGLFDAMNDNGWYAVVSSETVTFRKSLQLWQRFEVQSRFIGHDVAAFTSPSFSQPMMPRLLRSEPLSKEQRFLHAGVPSLHIIPSPVPAQWHKMSDDASALH